MRVLVTIGRAKLEFKAKSNYKGVVEWNQVEEKHSLELPADPAQIPDIVIYLVSCYQRSAHLRPQKFS